MSDRTRHGSFAPSVIFACTDRLGNQLFQYAAAYALARRLGLALRADYRAMGTRWAGSASIRELVPGLQPASVAEVGAIFPRWRGPRGQLLWAWLGRLLPASRLPLLAERFPNYDARILQVRGPVYLRGWWQSEKYFAHLAPDFRRTLDLRAPTRRAAELAARLGERPVVAIHVRRGDYLEPSGPQRRLFPCSSDYYRRAFAEMARRFPDAGYAIFSDDPAWAAENIRPPGPVVLPAGDPPRTDREDFYLLTRCRHFIIANSTFSWWGAWLGRDGEGTVIAPREWFRGVRVRIEDRLPADWLAL
jgi:hypothetical protein